VEGGWRRLHIEELHKFYAPSSIFKVIKLRAVILEGHVAHIQEMKYAYSILVEESEAKRPLGRSRCSWE
jgi:hypothetical protein